MGRLKLFFTNALSTEPCFRYSVMKNSSVQMFFLGLGMSGKYYILKVDYADLN